MILGGELLDIKGTILIEVESSEGPLNRFLLNWLISPTTTLRNSLKSISPL